MDLEQNIALNVMRTSVLAQLLKNLLTNEKKLHYNATFAFFGRFLRSYAKTDVTMMFSAIFRSRSTYFQLCTTLGAPGHVPNTSNGPEHVAVPGGVRGAPWAPPGFRSGQIG